MLIFRTAAVIQIEISLTDRVKRFFLFAGALKLEPKPTNVYIQIYLHKNRFIFKSNNDKFYTASECMKKLKKSGKVL